MRCFCCGGPAHPATGCQYTETMVQCYRCTVEFWAWVRRHTGKRWGAPGTPNFYECAAKWQTQPT